MNNITETLLEPIKDTLIEQNEKKLQEWWIDNEGYKYHDDEMIDRYDDWVSSLSTLELNNLIEKL